MFACLNTDALTTCVHKKTCLDSNRDVEKRTEGRKLGRHCLLSGSVITNKMNPREQGTSVATAEQTQFAKCRTDGTVQEDHTPSDALRRKTEVGTPISVLITGTSTPAAYRHAQVDM